MADLHVSAGDYGYDLTFTIQTASSAVFDLTGKTITLKVWKPGRPETVLVNDTATAASPTTGVCVYTVASTDFVVIGRYNAELEMTEAGKIDSTKPFTLQVDESA